MSEIIRVWDAEAKRHDIEIGDNGCGDARQQQPLWTQLDALGQGRVPTGQPDAK